MHLVTDCKAPTKCRNCGGPHRSDSRNCLARPSRSGPVTKYRLKTIRQMSQREYHAEARAKVAIIRAEAAAINEETPSICPKNNLDIISTNEVDMSEASIDVGTSSEIQL
ncbi:putative eka-like protein [Erysiphe necator]|uniref:Putative eka-like protein n=1 Tax=Uncinula necator TaxID=52586 RepID=A0A0B1P765_UNCNE|nr:putative eka-like protein [Erysiphe necator]